MKLASLDDGTRDGRLVVVSRDLTRFTDAAFLVPTLQAALDDWRRIAPHLATLAESLEHGAVPSERFHEHDALSPLPRAYQWADGSAYVNHVELVRRARGAEMPESFWTDPLIYQGGSDAFLAPARRRSRSPTRPGASISRPRSRSSSATCRPGCRPTLPARRIRLVMLVNDVSLRHLVPAELAKGFGFFQSKPSSAFSPVAVTPDELGEAWDGGRLHLPLAVDLNGEPFGRAACRGRQDFRLRRPDRPCGHARGHLSAGSIIGSGTISNKLDGGPGKPLAEGGVGYLLHRRAAHRGNARPAANRRRLSCVTATRCASR